jgi:hypothetical protein
MLLMATAVAPGTANASVSDGFDGMLVLGVAGRDDFGTAVHGERIVVADPRTGDMRARRVPGGTLCYGVPFAVGDRVLFNGNDGRRAEARSLPLTLEGAPRSLGRADSVTPSAGPGRVWLGRWRPRGRGFQVAVREVDLDHGGGIVGQAWRLLPRSTRFEAAFEGGFVTGHEARLRVWDRTLERPLHSVGDGWLVAAGGSRVAWCAGSCRTIQVWEGDAPRVVTPPLGLHPQAGGDAAFSPDGDRLALPVTDRSGASRVAIVNLADDDWTMVPGARVRGYGAIAWSPLGAWVYLTAGGDRILAWAPGMERATRVPVETGGTVMSIATAG